MISAKEASEITANSTAAVDRYIQEKIEPVVLSAAEKGLNSCKVTIGTVYTYEEIDCTAVETRVLGILKELGYRATVETYGDPYVPRGLQNDMGVGPRVRNYGFLISW